MNPEELLQQIAELMGEYLAMGPDTPLYETFSQVMPEIAQGAGALEGAEAPEGGMPPPSGGPGLPPMTGDARTDFGAANAGATQMLEQQLAGPGGQGLEEEQPPPLKKKKAKAA